MSEPLTIAEARRAAARATSLSSKDEVARRRPIYADVEELISPGFISQQAVVGGVNVSLRSLGPGDFLLLRHRIGLAPTLRQWKEWAVATAIWMVDGQSVLGDVNAAHRLQKTLRSLPVSGLEALFSIYTALHNRVNTALGRVEAFCYEDFSRATWRMFSRGNPARDDVAGVVGVSALGMNHAQRMWVAFNHAEDDRQDWQREWAAAKLVASATSPKGVRKLNQRDESERKLDAEMRQREISRVYHDATGRAFEDANGMVVRRAVTAEDLVDEMNRWVRGEKDWHDTVIDAYKDKIREQHERDRERHETRMRELDQLYDEVGATGQTMFVGHTLEQLQALRGKDGESLNRKGVPVAMSSAPARLYDKYISRDIPVGGVTDHGAVALPLSEGDENSLTEAVRNRQVQLFDQ